MEVMPATAADGEVVMMVDMEVTEAMVADPEARPLGVCPEVCAVASNLEGAEVWVPAEAPRETSLTRERGIKKTKKKKKLQKIAFSHSESVQVQIKNMQKLLPNTNNCKNRKIIMFLFLIR